jgi:hypothetical protein
MQVVSAARDRRRELRRRCGVALKSVASVLALTTLCACDAKNVPSQPRAWFVDDAARSKLDFTYVSHLELRHWFPEICGGGVGLLDYDNDGWLDVYFVQGGDLEPGQRALPGNQLFRNRGDGTFQDVTQRAGVGDTHYGMGCACADYDGDGDVDIYVTNVGRNVLYQNQGDGTFRDVTDEAGVGDHGWSSSAVFVDYDRDGELDLYVAHYIRWSPQIEHTCITGDGRADYCDPLSYQAPEPDTLFHNLGGGRFEDVSDRAGVHAADGNGLGVACGDFDGNGWPDIFVANDMQPNQLWLNDGAGHFEDGGLLHGCALARGGFPEAGMGLQAVDLEPDGDLDLLISHLRNQKNTLYLNDGRGNFDDMSGALGFALPSLPYTGFGLGFADFDHDTALEVFIANGRVSLESPAPDPKDPYAEPSLLMTAKAPDRYEEVFPRGGTSPTLLATSRGAAFGDIDNDGDIDIVVVNRDAPAFLLRNQIADSLAWIMFDVRDERGRTAIGARVGIEAGGRVQYRQVDPGYSYLASNDPRVHFGLGKARAIDHARVRWTDGREDDFGPFQAGRLYVLRRTVK